ncbi:MAG: ACT domain-containing protein [Acidimicrobiales bacterium]
MTHRFVVRLWIPDRPGALGAVASRIGAVRGDVVGIDILERGAGRAVDELVVELPDASLVGLLVQEMSQVDGVDVEDVRPAPAGGGLPDARLDALDAAAALVASKSPAELWPELGVRARQGFEADWCVVFDPEGSAILGTSVAPLAPGQAPVPSPVPALDWLVAFAAGGGSSDLVAAGDTGPEDVAWATLSSSGRVLVLGRLGRPFRALERRQLATLARIADLCQASMAATEPRAGEVEGGGVDQRRPAAALG